jgi:RNA-directed DNA polymerase
MSTEATGFSVMGKQHYRAVDQHVYESVRHFLKRRHNVPTRGTRQFSRGKVYGKLGVVRLRDIQYGARP